MPLYNFTLPEVVNGYYKSNSGIQTTFSATYYPELGQARFFVFVTGGSLATAVNNVQQDGTPFTVDKLSFDMFKSGVLNKNSKWTNVNLIDLDGKIKKQVDEIPGTWTSEDASQGGSSRKPNRNRRSSRRKSNKRRRSRRNVNRKTKKLNPFIIQ